MLLAGTALQAQHEMSAFTATGRAGVSTTTTRDYQSVGINPANLGMIRRTEDVLEEKKVVSIGLAEVGLSVHSDALSRPDLRTNLFSFNAIQGGDTLTPADKVQAALDFADAGIQVNGDVMAVGVAVQPSRDVGGFGFQVRDRFTSGFRFNTSAADILFNGFNAAYFDSLVVNGTDTTGFSTQPVTLSGLFSGSRFTLNWYREFSLAYGRVIVDEENFDLYLGVGGKYLMGIGYMDVNIQEGFSAFSALGPVFNVDYTGVQGTNAIDPSRNFASVGSGFGFDAGITVAIGESEQFKIGASLTDIGRMRWNGNVFSAQDTVFNGISGDGIDSYNLIDEIEEVGANTDFFQWEGLQSVDVNLPTMLRIGASWQAHQMLQLSTDLVLPINDVGANLDNALYAFGVDFTPVDWFRFSTGFATSSEYSFTLPVGAYFRAGNGVYEVGVASRDAVTFFAKNTPTLSIALGFLRFRF